MYKSRRILTSNMFANCFFKKRILPCCDVMGFFEYRRWRITSVFVFFCPSIFQKLSILSKIKADVIVTLNVLVDKLK